jgi:ABC-type multidrug transport system fused ATPase/permease subunit
VKDPMRFRTEQEAASDILLHGAAIATPLLSNFSAWLMAGLSAAFTLFFSNIASVTKYVYSFNIRWSLILFTVSLLAGLLARFLSVSVTSSLISNDVFGKRVKETVDSANSFVFPAFFRLLFSGMLLPYRCIASRTLDAVKRGDLMASARFTAKTSQAQALLVLVQIAFATASVIVLACGIKV